MNRRKFIGGVAASALPSPRSAFAAGGSTESDAGSAGPLVVSSNGRYFINQPAGKPWLMLGDAAWNLPMLSPQDAEYYIANRAALGFNAIMWTFTVDAYAANPSPIYAAYGGLSPFTGAKVTTPNATYFDRMLRLVQICQKHGVIAILDPYETGSGLPDLTAAGASGCYAYGKYVGSILKNQPNVFWQLGNDYGFYNGTNTHVMIALARGILSAMPSAPMTIEIFVPKGIGTPSTTFHERYFNFMTCNGVYTYGPTYGYTLVAYNNSSVRFEGVAGTNNAPPVPVVFLEGSYEYEHLGIADPGLPITVRKQFWWSILSGACGGIYGNGYVWPFGLTGGSNISVTGGEGGKAGSWKDNLTTAGVKNLQIWKAFFESLPWYDLVPDQTHVIGVAGYGTPALTGPFASNDCVTLAATANGRCAAVYFPQGGSNRLTVALGGFAGPVTAKWVDPTTGGMTTIGTVPNRGSHDFAPSGNNAARDPDWALLLTA
jgi:hypothetical protein